MIYPLLTEVKVLILALPGIAKKKRRKKRNEGVLEEGEK